MRLTLRFILTLLFQLKATLSGGPHFHLYTPETVPSSWGQLISPLPPVLLVAEPGYAFLSNHYASVRRDHPWENDPEAQQGQHGYPPDVPDMHTAFYGYGPAFSAHVEVTEDLHTFDVHAVLEGILFGRRPTGAVEKLIMTGARPLPLEPGYLVVVVVCSAVVLLVIALAALRLRQMRRRYGERLLDEDFSYDENEDKA